MYTKETKNSRKNHNCEILSHSLPNQCCHSVVMERTRFHDWKNIRLTKCQQKH